MNAKYYGNLAITTECDWNGDITYFSGKEKAAASSEVLGELLERVKHVETMEVDDTGSNSAVYQANLHP